MGQMRLVVLGAGKTGKSALTIQFIQGRFFSDYDGTVEDSYRKTAEVDGKPCSLDIVDTAGQEEYRSSMAIYYQKGDGFLLVYSVLDQNSFNEVCEMHEQLVKNRPEYLSPSNCPDGQHVPIVLVGNKIDKVGQADRQVEKAQGERMAREWKAKFFETSAKTRDHVEDSFHDLIRLVLKARSRGELEQQRTRQASTASYPPAAAAGGRERGDSTKDDDKDKKDKKRKRKDKKDKKKCTIL